MRDDTLKLKMYFSGENDRRIECHTNSLNIGQKGHNRENLNQPNHRTENEKEPETG